MAEMTEHLPPRASALVPFGIFLLFYLGISLWAGDFYSVSMPVAFLVAGAAALALKSPLSFAERVEHYARGMGENNIMIMCLIFLLAGAFAAVTKAMGAVDAAVLLTRHVMPPEFFLTGMFCISALISLAIGTSCGTIAALTPVALGLPGAADVPTTVMLGAVAGGAMFGDNLSMISDTTIAATRTQDVAMQDKFKVNFKLVLPCAVLTLLIYLFAGTGAEKTIQPELPPILWKHGLLILPYILLLVLALAGWNVMILLGAGTVFAGIIGIFSGPLTFRAALDVCGKGVLGMSETLIVALLAGGLLAMIRFHGGVTYLLDIVTRKIRTAKGAEAGVFFLTGIINLFTANNTVAIVIAGPIARELGTKFHCDPKRIAGILDTASCFVQGVIPYGAQILIAAGLAKTAGVEVSSLSLAGAMLYPWLMGAAILLNISLRRQSCSSSCCRNQ